MNEEIILENVIDNLIIDLNEILTQYEIIIVENGSNDSTINITEKLKLKYKNLFLLKRKPKICIHIEPIVELLDENIFLDYFQSYRIK